MLNIIMDIILIFIDTLEIWHYFISALILFLIGSFIGDEDILPWIGASLFISGILELIGLGPLIILSLFPFQLILLFKYAKPMLYGPKNKSTLIAEDINSMLNKQLRISKVDAIKSHNGEGTSPNGKKWNVSHINRDKLVIGDLHTCISIEGITLIIK